MSGIRKVILSIDSHNRLAYFLLAFIVSVFVINESSEIFEKETIYNGYDNTISRILPNCDYLSTPYSRGQVNWYLVCAGYLTFGNTQVVPFLISLGVIPMAFLLARQQSRSNTVGLGTAVLVCTAPTFLVFNTSSAYAQTWVLFLVSSMYCAQKNKWAAFLLFGLAVFSKSLAIAFIPILILLSRFERLQTVLYGMTGAGVLVFAGIFQIHRFGIQDITLLENTMQEAFRWSLYMPVSAALVLVWQYYKSGIRQSSIMFVCAALTVPVVSAFTNEGYFAYRTIPIVVMFGYMISDFVVSKYLSMFSTQSIPCAKSP